MIWVRSQCAALKASSRALGTRPRSETSQPLTRPQSRIARVCSFELGVLITCLVILLVFAGWISVAASRNLARNQTMDWHIFAIVFRFIGLV